MAIGIIRNIGGQNSTPFTWVGSTKTWTKGLSLTLSGSIVESISEPLSDMPTNCNAYVNLEIYPTSGQTIWWGLWIANADAQTPTWTALQEGQANATQAESLTIDISSYAGQNVIFKLRANGRGTFSATRFDVTNV